MREIIAAIATGTTSVIGAIYIDANPTAHLPARAAILGAWVITLYLLHRIGRENREA